MRVENAEAEADLGHVVNTAAGHKEILIGVLMDVKVLVNEKNVIELDLGSADQSLAQLLVEKLNEDKDVDFASYKVEHPIMANPKIYLRTKKGEPGKLLLEKLDEIKNEVSDFKKQFLDVVK
jgi:DNA-directed RNA polymerase subunit L